MTHPLSELDYAYLEAHEQSRRLHQPPRPDLQTFAAAVARAFGHIEPSDPAAEARHLARGFTHPADTD